MEYSPEDARASRFQRPDPVWRFTPRLDGTCHVTVLNEDGIVRYLSRPLCHLLGLKARACVGRPLWELLRKESAEIAREAVGRMAEDASSFEKWKLCFRSTSSDKQWMIGKAINFLRDPRLGGIIVWWEPAALETPHISASSTYE